MQYYGGHGFGHEMSFGIFGTLLHLALLIFAIWVIISLLRGFGIVGRGKHWHWHTHPALSILNERFAKGEIDKAEYEERKKALMGQ